MARVGRDEKVVGREALRRRRECKELDAGASVHRNAAAAHDFVILCARRVTRVHPGGRRNAEGNAGRQKRFRTRSVGGGEQSEGTDPVLDIDRHNVSESAMD